MFKKGLQRTGRKKGEKHLEISKVEVSQKTDSLKFHKQALIREGERELGKGVESRGEERRGGTRRRDLAEQQEPGRHALLIFTFCTFLRKFRYYTMLSSTKIQGEVRAGAMLRGSGGGGGGGGLWAAKGCEALH
ncbi:hypothetical protein EVAR_96054_1 [Eumeta japonica]|uniref:Uncharacterized protein n=1 Tax=Eumeta variegata TaxID=151549 RepID=A0A4C1W987_EUMVA|nr:hypothetical protein EVAR_96054_1 [Eumeta japonica]